VTRGAGRLGFASPRQGGEHPLAVLGRASPLPESAPTARTRGRRSGDGHAHRAQLLLAQTWAGILSSVVALDVLRSTPVGRWPTPVGIQVARFATPASRSARLPGSRVAAHATPPIANISSGHASIQMSDDDIVAVVIRHSIPRRPPAPSVQRRALLLRYDEPR
jgi:hypothetical protein